MKLFVLCRHGSCENGHMDSLGEHQFKFLADRLRPRVQGLKVRVVGSTAPRASECTDVLVRELALTDRHDDSILWCDNHHPWDYDRATQLLVEQSQDVDVLIVVTHWEYTDTLPYRYACAMFSASVSSKELDKGHACVLNCEDHSISYIP